MNGKKLGVHYKVSVINNRHKLIKMILLKELSDTDEAFENEEIATMELDTENIDPLEPILTTPTSKKQKKQVDNLGDKYKKALQEIVNSNKIEDTVSDEYRNFGNLVESTLRKLTEENSINAMSEIQAILTRYRLKNIASSTNFLNIASPIASDFSNSRDTTSSLYGIFVQNPPESSGSHILGLDKNSNW